MDADLILKDALDYKLKLDEDSLRQRDPEAYDLNVNGVRHIHVNQEEGDWIIWDVVSTPKGTVMVTKYDRNII